MNVWLIGATVLACGLLPCLYVCLREPLLDAIVGLELASAIGALVLLLLAEGFHRSSYYDVAVVAALMSWIGGIVFTRFLARRL